MLSELNEEIPVSTLQIDVFVLNFLQLKKSELLLLLLALNYLVRVVKGYPEVIKWDILTFENAVQTWGKLNKWTLLL